MAMLDVAFSVPEPGTAENITVIFKDVSNIIIFFYDIV